jgi:hypothetical protein
MPGLMRAVERRAVLGLFGGLAIGTVGVVLMATTRRTPRGAQVFHVGLTLLLLAAAAWVLAFAAHFVNRARVRRRVRAAEGCLCWECGYDLDALRGGGEAGGACPECGEIFQFTRLRRDWRRVVGLYDGGERED